MTCREYLSLHSELLDERLELADASRCRAHVDTCPSCARYDRVVRRGLTLVRELPQISPSPDFHQRLQHRIFHVQDDIARGDRFATASAAVALAIAGVIAFAAWSPMLGPPEVGQASGAMVRGAEEALRVVAEPEPPAAEALGNPRWWYGETQRSVFSYASMNLYPTMSTAPAPAMLFPGPYSPLIVAPPSVRRGGSVLARYSE